MNPVKQALNRMRSEGETLDIKPDDLLAVASETMVFGLTFHQAAHKGPVVFLDSDSAHKVFFTITASSQSLCWARKRIIELEAQLADVGARERELLDQVVPAAFDITGASCE